MKNLVLILISCALVISCSTNTKDSNEQVLKKSLEEDFKASNPDAKNISWEVEGDYKEVEYTENGIEKSILYDAEGKIIESEIEIEAEQLGETILTYIEENYPEAEIEEAEKVKNADGIFYEVEIETEDDQEIELLFSKDGSYIKEEIETDDEGEEDDVEGEENEVEIDPSELPAAIVEYIDQNYPDYSITEAEKETSEDGTFFEVELTSPDGEEIDLVFDLDGNFLEIEED